MISDHGPDDDDDDVEEWTGIARRGGEFFALTGILPEFILDYKSYDPASQTEPRGAAFRDGVMTVTTENGDGFVRALKGRRLSISELRRIVDSSTPDLLALIDFDTRRYVHSYYDLPLEDYVPSGWRGRLGDPREELGKLLPPR